MRKTESILKTALPYLFGGAVFYFVWRKIFKRDDSIDVIEADARSARARYEFMSEDEKDEYADKVCTHLSNTLADRWFSSFRNNDDVIAIIKENSFCIVRIGKKFDRPYLLSLSDYLAYSLSSSDMHKIVDEVDMLVQAGY